MGVGEWDRRELCPDGACTGLIGPEGTCKTCGRAAPNWGEERKRGLATDEADDDEEYEDDEEEEMDKDAPIAPRAGAEIGGWSQRSLCPDGACIGLIGEDGKCKECGKTGVPGGPDEDDEYEDDDDDEDDEYDEDDEEYEDEDEDDELAAAADELAGVASNAEVEAVDQLAKTADDEDNRKLCPDGACIGLIGPDGKCKECGKEAEA